MKGKGPTMKRERYFLDMRNSKTMTDNVKEIELSWETMTLDN